MANSETATAATKCFSGAIRRLLCTGSLPTHPSDHIPESSAGLESKPPRKECKNSVAEETVEAGGSPGIVARLMGLDWLPENNRVPSVAALSKITRSMSVNFMDYFPEFDRAQDSQHRRVRTSVSFREVPTFLDQQNRDSVFLFMENVEEDKQKKTERKVVARKKESQEKKRALRRKNEPRRESRKPSSKLVNCYGVEDSGLVLLHRKKDLQTIPKVKIPVEEESVGTKFKQKKDKKLAVKKIDHPVSVLDRDRLHPIHHQASRTEHSREMGTRKKKSSSKTANWDYPSPNLVRISNTDDQEQRSIMAKDNQQLKKDYYMEMFSKVCRLTEEDIKESNWIAKEECKTEFLGEICMEFEQQIFNMMLHQVVEELEEFPHVKA